jgi:hypothetical protein
MDFVASSESINGNLRKRCSGLIKLDAAWVGYSPVVDKIADVPLIQLAAPSIADGKCASGSTANRIQ